MRILKILLISTALAAFGAASALATTTPVASTGQTTVKPKSTKLVKKKFVKKKYVAKKTKKKIFAKVTKPKTTPPSTEETAPGSPPPSKTE
jgi:hypothetical protein